MDRLEAYTGFLQVSLDEEAAAEAWAVERREAEAAARAAARRQQQQQQATAAIAAAASASASGSVGVGAAAGSPHAPARRLSTAFPDASAPLRAAAAAAAAAAPAEDAGVILGGGVAAKATTGAVLEIQPQLMCVQIQYCPLLPSIAPPITPHHVHSCVLLCFITLSLLRSAAV